MAGTFIRQVLRSTPIRWMLRNRVSRVEIIQKCIDARKASTYLEIGIANGDCFAAVSAPRKIGVDPLPASTQVEAQLRMPGVSYFPVTSDTFFDSIAPRTLTKGVDVVFIDGLHTYEQAFRDCSNALRYLTSSGIVLVHDCLPTSESEGRPAKSYEEAARLNGADGVPWNGAWMGDVWRAILALRQDPNLTTRVLDCDCGIGVVQRKRDGAVPRITDSAIRTMPFSEVATDAKAYLGLRRPIYLTWALSRR